MEAMQTERRVRVQLEATRRASSSAVPLSAEPWRATTAVDEDEIEVGIMEPALKSIFVYM